MPNEYFNPTHSTDEIWRAQNMDICLTDDLDTIEANITTLTSSVAGKADVTHTHTDYAAINHTHDSYAASTHSHTDYAGVNHTHSGYATAEHSHTGYASTTDLARLQTLVGDTSVSSQIATAVASKADVSHTHSDYATTSYVDTTVAGLVDSAPETLNTLNELAAALGDDPNFATTIATQIGNKADASHTHSGMITESDIARAGVTNPWGKIPAIGGDGVLEVGKYIDFHEANSTSDYTPRLMAQDNALFINSSQILTSGGVKDWVIEQGVSGNLRYQKWESGKSEAWYWENFDVVELTSALANNVWSNTSYNARGISFPSGLFTTIPTATCNVYSNGYTFSQVASATKDQLIYRIWSPYSTTISGCQISIHVIGRWK